MAKYLKDKDDIRIVSLGTGEVPAYPIKSERELSKSAYALRLSDFMMSMDINTAFEYLEEQYFIELNQTGKFIRANINSSYQMDAVDDASINGMVKEGEEMWNTHQVKLK